MRYLYTLVLLIGILSFSSFIEHKEKAYALMPEICDNGIDDDMDGLIDLNDDDCDCQDEVMLTQVDLILNPTLLETNGCCTINLTNDNNCIRDWVIVSPSPDFYHPDCLSPDELQEFESENGITLDEGIIRTFLTTNSPTSESFGTCFTRPLKEGHDYEISFDALNVEMSEGPSPLNVALFGVTDCNDLELMSMESPCSNSKFTELAHFESFSEIGLSGWTSLTLSFVADKEYTGFFFNVSCSEFSHHHTANFVYYSHFAMMESDTIVIDLQEEGKLCSNDLQLSTENIEDVTFQWYKDGVAILGETSLIFNPQEEGVYELVATAVDGSCISSEEYVATLDCPIETVEEAVICKGGTYEFYGSTYGESGVYSYLDESTTGGCDTLHILSLYTTPPIFGEEFVEFIFFGSTYFWDGMFLTEQGEYNQTFTTAEGCDSINILLLIVIPILEDEICDNNIDDNGDGLIDAFDPDCQCEDTVLLQQIVLNPNFDEHTGCCNKVTNDSNGNCLDDWQYVTGTPDYYHIDCLGPVGISEVEQIFLNVFDDNFISVGFSASTTESVATCLGSTMLAGELYEIEIDVSLPSNLLSILPDGSLLTIHGWTTCEANFNTALSQGEPGFCATSASNSTIPIMKISSDDMLDMEMKTFTASYTPSVDINALIISTDCDPSSPLGSSFWQIGRIEIFGAQLQEWTFEEEIMLEEPCINPGNISVPYSDTLTYQWYVNEFPIMGEDSAVLEVDRNVYDLEDIFHVYVYNDNGCVLIGPYLIPVGTININANQRICEGDTLVFGTQLLFEAGSYYESFETEAECDSNVTFIIDMDMAIQETELDVTICEGDTLFWEGQEIFEEGIYNAVIGVLGRVCDSLVTMDVSILAAPVISISEFICTGESYPFAGQMLDTGGDYTDTLTTSGGCDSIVNLSLTIDDFKFNFISDSICAGDQYTFGMMQLDMSGTYRDTISRAEECDSIVILELLVKDLIQFTDAVEICAGESYNFGNMSYDQTGIYKDTIAGIEDCDSIVTLELLVKDPIQFSDDVEICAGESYDFGNMSYDQTGIYIDTLSSVEGCDSMVTIELNVLPYEQELQTIHLCDLDTIDFGGQVIFSAGEYRDTIDNPPSCDLIIVLTVTQTEDLNTDITETICQGGSYDFMGLMLSDEGEYFDTLITQEGCDSIIKLQLNVSDFLMEDVEVSICEGESFLFVDNELMTAGLYSDTLSTDEGCDSIINLNLEIIVVDPIETDALLCAGDTLFINGETIFEEGSYPLVFSSVLGCDSTVIYNVDIELPVLGDTTFTTAQEGTIYSFFGEEFDQSGEYAVVIQSEEGCDSIIYLVLEYLTEPKIYMPNVFNPNSLAGNDRFVIVSNDDAIIETYDVYDRWGNSIHSRQEFDVKDLSLFWDGRINNQPAATGVYVYRVKVRYSDGSDDIVVGNVTLIW